MIDRGSFIEQDGRPAVRFVRTYPHPVERVWEAVSTPAGLGHWFPSQVELDPVAGGTIRFSGDPNMEGSTGTVLAFDPPHRLAFTWGPDELRFELTAAGDGSCTLTLEHVLDERDAAARTAAGWSVCLGELDLLVAGTPGEGPRVAGTHTWQPRYDEYVAAGMPSGAAIPGHS